MKKGAVVSLSAIFLLAFACVAAQAGQKYLIKFGHANEPNHYHHFGALKFAELVKDRTKGEVVVEVFPAQQLGTEPEMFSLVSQNTIQMTVLSPGHVGSFVTPIQIMLCPYIWRDYDHLKKVMDGPVGDQFRKLLLDQNVRGLDFLFINGFRHLTTLNVVGTKPADFKGVKIRAPQAPVYVAAVKGMGGDPVIVDFGELYMALQQRIAEGQENALGTVDSRKYYEVQKNVMLTGHILQSQLVLMSEEFYKSLPPEYQKIVTEAAAEARDYNNKLEKEAERAAIEKFKKMGMKILEVDVPAFRENSRQYITEIEKLWGGRALYDQIVNTK